VLAPRVVEIVVSSPRPVSGFRSVADTIAGAGPLGGIAAGLAAISTPWLLVVAGDMPYLGGALVDRMLAATDASVDSVAIRSGGLPEPLVCVLHARTRAAVERRLAAGAYKASGLLTDEGLRVRWIEVDSGSRELRSINAPDDLRRE
jgi:molybdopterin-guanine dinucleotide biosynthesis protein A